MNDSTARIDEVRLDIDPRGVARVTIDRQHVLNAVDHPTWDRLNDIWASLEADDSVRVVVVTGAGPRAFCAGADMSAASVDKTGLQYWADKDPNGFGGLSLRRSLDTPIIARVNGYALGGGMEMVLGADIVVAAESAQFALPEPRVGRLALDGGIPRLVRRIPYTQAMGMLVTGRRVPAAELAGFGLVNQVVPDQDLDQAVEGWVEQILQCAPTSVRAVKQMVNRTAHLSAAQARDAALPALMASLQSAEQDEGVNAFREKRLPAWAEPQ
ncbi:MAG: enoyl-CoA hydratase-related protein [Beutenbergiaceae bacterium]